MSGWRFLSLSSNNSQWPEENLFLYHGVHHLFCLLLHSVGIIDQTKTNNLNYEYLKHSLPAGKLKTGPIHHNKLSTATLELVNSTFLVI